MASMGQWHEISDFSFISRIGFPVASDRVAFSSLTRSNNVQILTNSHTSLNGTVGHKKEIYIYISKLFQQMNLQ